MTNIRRGMMGAAGGAGGYTLWSWGFNGEGPRFNRVGKIIS